MTSALSMMRQIWITRHGPPDVLALRERAVPTPGAGSVLIKVSAAGVNFADIMARLGVYPDAPKPPCVVGYEVAGEVVAVGPSATTFSSGQRVVALTRFGGYSSHVSVPERQAFALPTTLGFAEGAALPVTYLTAYLLMISMGRLGAGETVLVHSAGGGVGRIDARAKGLASQVRALTEGRGVDLALDARGGGSWRQSYDCLAPTGRLAVFGLASAVGPGGRFAAMARAAASLPWTRFNLFRLMNDNRGIFGVNVGHLWNHIGLLRGAMEQLLEWEALGKLRPVVDRAFPLQEAAAAHRYIEGRHNIGKVVLTP